MRAIEAAALAILLAGINSIGDPASAAAPPPPRSRAEIEGVLARSPGPPPAERQRPLRILLVANEKDHGPEEHDYPLWQKRWGALFSLKAAGGETRASLFGPDPAAGDRPERTRSGGSAGEVDGLPGVTVATAWGWPGKDEIAKADVVVAFIGTGGRWSRERIADLDALLDRGAGFVAIHSAVIADKELAKELAGRIGLAWEDGTTTFRHGPLDLEVRALEHPICLGLPTRIGFVDETYWPLVGDLGKVDVLATADERMPPGTGAPAPQPMLWTLQRGKGRAVGCLLGHYTWTFDDPYCRIILLRSIGWAGRASPFRLDPLVLRGARTGEGTETARPETRKRPKVAAKAPDPKDPRLLLWLDASARETLTVDPDGLVTDWSSRAAPGRGLSSSGARRPAYVAEGIGGKHAVRFDGKDDILRDTGFRKTVMDWTLLVAFSMRSNEGWFRGIFSSNRTDKNDYVSGINVDLGGGPTASFECLNLEGIQLEGQSNLKDSSSPFGAHVVAIVRGGGRARASVDGLAEGERASGDVPAFLEEIRIGSRIYENPAGKLPLVERGTLDGDIAEVILFGAALGDEERAGAEAYLIEKYGAEIVEVREPTIEEAWEKLPSYDATKGRRALGPIDLAIDASHGEAAARRSIEDRLLEALAAAKTWDARDFICRRLGIMGTERSIPALAALLADERLSHPARVALERIGGPASASALREALGNASGKARAGIIDSIGRLGGPQDVPVLAGLLAGGDPDSAAAAATALGRLGAVGPLLEAAKGNGPAAVAAGWALIDLAYRYLESGKNKEAAEIFGILGEFKAEAVRSAARKGLEKTKETK
jgi:type 1 glutamine amidotransferase